MSWKWAALLPHPPILVPEIGRSSAAIADATLQGVMSVANAIFDDGSADAILLLSPHQPYIPGAFFVNSALELTADFSAFDAPDVAMHLTPAREEIESLAAFFTGVGAGIPVMYGEQPDLSDDQGTLVPLYFLRKALGILPRTVPSSPIGLSRRRALELGRALAQFDDGRSWGLIASGDLSHRLLEGGPNGYSPAGAIFDSAICEAIRANDPTPIMRLTEDEIESAGECGMRSVLVMLGLVGAITGGERSAMRLYSHEAPFGVGYGTAYWSVDQHAEYA